MFKKFLLVIGLLFVGTICAQAQSTCRCTLDDGSHAAANCPAGYTAVCACSSTGCNSTCAKLAAAASPGLQAGTLLSLLRTTAAGGISETLSKFYGRSVVFEPAAKNFTFDHPPAKTGASHWDVLDLLAAKGKLTINGQSLEFWETMRNNLLRGGEHTISTGGGTVQTILNEISFISGKRFSITSGNAAALVTEPIKGKGLTELIENLSKAAKVTISEN